MFNDFDNEQGGFEADYDNSLGQQDYEDSSADFFNQNQQQNVPNFDEGQQDVQTSFGYKTVGIVVAVVLILIALILMFFSNIKFVKKDTSTQSEQQVVQQQEQTDNQNSQVLDSTTVPNESTSNEDTQSSSNQEQVDNSNNAMTTQPSTDSTTLINIEDHTHIDYSGTIYSTQGVVKNLTRHLQDGQVIYCIKLEIVIGQVAKTVNYYCGYNVYKQVELGDILTVDYQQVSETCFSVCTIYK